MARFAGASRSARYSWKDSRMHSAKKSGSGTCSRLEVGEMMTRPSSLVIANTSPSPSLMGMRAEK